MNIKNDNVVAVRDDDDGGDGRKHKNGAQAGLMFNAYNINVR